MKSQIAESSLFYIYKVFRRKINICVFYIYIIDNKNDEHCFVAKLTLYPFQSILTAEVNYRINPLKPNEANDPLNNI
jgi:hypothetical protein